MKSVAFHVAGFGSKRRRFSGLHGSGAASLDAAPNIAPQVVPLTRRCPYYIDFSHIS
ncbi:unnamed protein product [Mycetohabitans rhizoxinica HKI 454]|uniref:Uncharacterized protein n=1 Tax=Mycetohabitans rhizoxinica (strain DSM 19002 / CIP 109453 / HKI 454) TaxID=882378 RepID=E5AN74_MYCRK|nr:unnamed protein product [Mycetohabitans rhizoxinica HKI 454]